MEATKQTPKLYCNKLAIEKGLDPVGSASGFEAIVVLEVPLPWKQNMYDKAGVLPQEVIDLFDLWLQRYRAGGGYHHQALMVAPDPIYSQEGHRRVMFYNRQPGMIAQFNKIEYVVPEAEMGQLVWALYQAQDNLPQFEKYRDATHDLTRDILVCTHGTVDVACAKFGYPLYNTLRKNYSIDHLRTWRASHFGGHVFAPTMMDMPTAHYWAYVEEPQAEQITQRCGNVHALYGHYRGWAGLDGGFLQAAERELWMQYGWAWFSFHKMGRILNQDNRLVNPSWADVEFSYTSPDYQNQLTYTARVEIRQHITSAHSSDSHEQYPYPQYVVRQIRKSHAAH